MQPPFPNGSSPLLFQLNSHLSSLHSSSPISSSLHYSPCNQQKPITSLVKPKMYVDNTWYSTHFVPFWLQTLSHIQADILNLSWLVKMFRTKHRHWCLISEEFAVVFLMNWDVTWQHSPTTNPSDWGSKLSVDCPLKIHDSYLERRIYNYPQIMIMFIFYYNLHLWISCTLKSRCRG